MHILKQIEGYTLIELSFMKAYSSLNENVHERLRFSKPLGNKVPTVSSVVELDG